MLECSIAVADRNSMYMHQIITGFTMLAEQRKICFSIKEKQELKQEFFHGAIIELIIEGKRVIYDLTDGYNNFPSFALFDAMLDSVDFYFKANAKEEYHRDMKNKAKIFTIGPRYYVTCKNSWLNNVNLKKMLLCRDSFEAHKLFHKCPFGKNANYKRYIEAFESLPIVNDEPKVFFYTRLWDPGIASSYSSVNKDLDGFEVEARIERKREEYANVSKLRAGLVRELKKNWGPNFIGGVAPSKYAQEYCPDLIGSTEMSFRSNYTKSMHSAEVCVNTQGTHNCWNFSFGEALAASRAIVTETPFYKTPDHLNVDNNFYAYQNIDQCLEKVNLLLSDKNILIKMMENNKKYYDLHLRPDKMVLDSLTVVLEERCI